jgi:hexosaminidase
MNPLLMPYPQKLELTGDVCLLPESDVIALHVPRPADLFFAAQQAQTALRDHAGVNWTIAGGDVGARLVIRLDTGLDRAESYRLTITNDGIELAGYDAAGIYYGVMTLAQLVQTSGRELPALQIEDWPDFPARGVMLDISRDKVPTMDTLYRLVDLLASWKVNQIQLYTEHTFAYQHHRIVWEHASPMTAEEILALDAYCRTRHIDLVPNQNSFGHMHRWFEHAPYLHMAETETEFTSPWGSTLPPFSLSPAIPATIPFLSALFDELLPNFTSTMFNVGADETVDLGMGRSKALVEQHGKGRVYLDFLLRIYEQVKARDLTMQFWGDIINQYPDLVPEIPTDTIALEWGYEADHDFPGKTKLFADSGVPFYVCPGTSSWRSIAGRTDNCIGNIRNAVENGLKHGAIGVLNTDWGDAGHWQPLPVSYLGFAYGAALSWASAPNMALDLPAVLDAFAFQDNARVMGRLAYDLGNAYQKPEILSPNSSVLFNVYHMTRDDLRGWALPAEALQDTLDYIDQVMAALDRAEMAVPDADLIKREFASAAQRLRHGAKRALFAREDGLLRADDMAADLDAIETEYRDLWLARNRPGGLDDSAQRLRRARALYQ